MPPLFVVELKFNRGQDNFLLTFSKVWELGTVLSLYYNNKNKYLNALN